jgi:hypothetical protein
VVVQTVAHRVGSDVHDPSVARLEHVRQHGSAAVDGRPEIPIDGLAHALLGVLKEWLDNPASRVVDENVDAPEPVECCGRHAVRACGSGHVRHESEPAGIPCRSTE